MTTKTGAFLCALTASLGVGAAQVPSSGYVYLTKDDPGGSYSFDANLGRWAEAGSTIDSGASMATDKDYLVQAESGYRVLRVGGNHTFAGRSLTLDNGELRISAGNPFTVNNLVVHKGMMTIAKADGGQVKSLGAISIQPGGELHLYGAYRRFLECGSAISGGANTKIIMDASENVGTSTGVPLPYWTACLSGDNAAFSGKIAVNALTYGGQYPSALVIRSGAALGACSELSFASRCALLGTGAEVVGKQIKAGGQFTVGSYTAGGSLGYGLSLGGGTTVTGTGSSVLAVTNCADTAVTVLDAVSLVGCSKIILLNGTTRFAAGYNNPSVDVEVMPGAKISAEEGAVLGSVKSAVPGGYVTSVAFPELDRGALRRNNDGFSYPLLSATSLDINDFHLFAGVTRESFVVRNNAAGVPTLYWERAADADHSVVWMNAQNDGDSFGYTTAYSSNWSNNEWPKKECDYIVENGYMLRNRSTRTFAGHLLTISSGGDLSCYASTTVNNLQLLETCRAMVRGTNTGSINGSAEIRTSEGGFVNFETENGTMTVSSQLSGYGNVRYRGFNGGTTFTGTINVTGENTAFVGKVALPHEKMTVRFKYESALGGNPRKFAADGLSVGDGVTLWCTATYPLSVTQPNRGVTVKGATKVDVQSGLTCRMTTPITGAGSLVKKSAGTLELGGANDFVGGVTLESGVLKLTSETALGAGALTYTAGSIDHVANDAVVVKGATPIVTTKPVPVRVAALDDDPHAWAPVFRFPDLASMTAKQAATLFSVSNVSAEALELDVTADEQGVLVSARKKTGLILIFK